MKEGMYSSAKWVADCTGSLLNRYGIPSGSAPSQGRPATVMLAPVLTADQRKAVKAFDLERWMPTLLSSRK